MNDPTSLLLSADPRIGRTDAVVVLRHGELAVERYGEGIGPDTTLRSWSMAKSLLHAVVGMLVADGRLELDARAPVEAWDDPTDPRHAITLRHLMTMRSGLAWVEAPPPGSRTLPDSVMMVYGHDGGPQPDTAAWAADRPLTAPPGSRTNYSSGNSAIVAGIVRDVVGEGAQQRRWLREHLFDPLGMASATPRFDAAGTWMASSFCFCTARDFARFGQLYLDRGAIRGERLLDPAWVATAAEPTGTDDGRQHTMHWWLLGDDPWGAYQASGYLGQHIIVVPPLDLVVVRTGETPTAHRDDLRRALVEMIAELADRPVPDATDRDGR